jgi:hypothetical protein
MDVDDEQSWLRSALTTPALLAECTLAQLALVFLLSPSRADPYVVAPLVCLYALREADRRAMMLYVVLSGAACPLDLAFLASPNAEGLIVKAISFASLLLKACLIYPAVKAHDSLPTSRVDRTAMAEPAVLHQRVQETVELTLREELQRLAVAPTQHFRPSSEPSAAASSSTPVSQPARSTAEGNGSGTAARERMLSGSAAGARGADAQGSWDQV